MSKRLRIIVLGTMGRIPFAGMAWEALHYVEGFRRLGHDVYYIEDSLDWPYDPEQDTLTDDPRYTVNHIARVMSWCGLSDRWAYRFQPQDGRIFGLSESEFKRVFERADVLVNWGAGTILRDEHLLVPARVCLETDPGLPEIEVAKGDQGTIEMLRAHTHYFTWAENLGKPGCGLPLGPFDFHPTRQPVILDWFAPSTFSPQNGNRRSAGLRFTTVSSWKQSSNDIEWNGETYAWSKHHEFLRFIDLPSRTRHELELALACDDADALHLLTSKGWRVIDALKLTKDFLPYRDYILSSDGEFTVAKDQNVRLRSGWFSERSAFYLTSGKPVITQDTGFGRVLPTGEGLFAFNNMEEVVSAFEAVQSDYERHSRAARRIAEDYFRAEDVLGKLIEQLNL
jgi:hypothetical protein